MADVPSFDQLYIGGKWVDPDPSERLEVISHHKE